MRKTANADLWPPLAGTPTITYTDTQTWTRYKGRLNIHQEMANFSAFKVFGIILLTKKM